MVEFYRIGRVKRKREVLEETSLLAVCRVLLRNAYNNQRHHESSNNVAPADVYFGRDKEIIEKRNGLTLALRRQQQLQRIGV